MNRYLLATALASALWLTWSPGPVSAETSDAKSARKPAKSARKGEFTLPPGSDITRGPSASPVGVRAGQEGKKPTPQVDPTRR